MSDNDTTFEEINREIKQFIRERDWDQYHDPMNLVMTLCSEVGELADHFRWLTSEEARDLINDSSKSAAVADEIADVLMFALELAAVCRIDVSDAIRSKLKANAVKYPIEKAKGSHLKYDQL